MTTNQKEMFGSLLLAVLYAAYSQVHSITHVYLIHVGCAAEDGHLWIGVRNARPIV